MLRLRAGLRATFKSFKRIQKDLRVNPNFTFSEELVEQSLTLLINM